MPKNMGGNIPGRNFLYGNFPGENSPWGNQMGGSFPRENFPDKLQAQLLLAVLKKYLYIQEVADQKKYCY